MSTAAACPRAPVVALSDLGRSPRMINHARALRGRGRAAALAGDGAHLLRPDLPADPAVRAARLDAGDVGFFQSLLGGSTPRLTPFANGRGPPQQEFARPAAGPSLYRLSFDRDLPTQLAGFRGTGGKALVLGYAPVPGEIFRPGTDGRTFCADTELAMAMQFLPARPRAQLAVAAEPGDTQEEEWDRELGAWPSPLEVGGTQP